MLISPRFTAEPVNVVPETERRYHYSSTTQHADWPPVSVRITPVDGDPWFASFNRADSAGPLEIAKAGNQTTLAIVAGRSGYIIDVDDPDAWLAVPAYVEGLRYLEGSDMVVFWDATSLLGYRGLTPLWRTGRLSYDGIRLASATEASLMGSGWSAPRATWVAFEVDLRTGASTGGASPPI